MNVILRKIGNSMGIIIPKEILDRFGLKEGDELSVVERNDEFALRPESDDLSEQLKAARVGMAKYRAALRELAK
jgi:putative addiction module antidote